MIEFKKGNLLDAEVDAIVNTVNTVGVMGKGIALMFKERFEGNFRAYAAACNANEVQLGKMFVQPTGELNKPHWIVNFPTKGHWRYPTKLQWIEDGLDDLKTVIRDKRIQSIAIPPLGCGNGGLNWAVVRTLLESKLSGLADVKIWIYEPSPTYQNIAKKRGVEQLTPARALIAEMVRRYQIIGFECTLLEIQKLAWFTERMIEQSNLENPLQLQFSANRYGPYADRLRHVLEQLDGSYLQCDKRINDAGPLDTITFRSDKQDHLGAFFITSEGKPFTMALDKTEALIEGFQSPLGMELLATVDWLLFKEHCEPKRSAIKTALAQWTGGQDAGTRKLRIFSDRMIDQAIERLSF